MPKFFIKQGDTSPQLEVVLKDGEGNVVDLTNHTLFFGMAETNGRLKVNSVATLISASAGNIRYEWAAGDTDTPGTYLAEFKIINPSGDVLSYPNSTEKQIEVIVEPEIA